MESTKQRIVTLREDLHRHNRNYYVDNSPSISDKEFDLMMKELSELEATHPDTYDPNSPTLRVGSDISKKFSQVAHEYPMLSLGNTYNYEELDRFFANIKTVSPSPVNVVAELKYDGLSISLIYLHGKLERAVTRGDGEKGDDVTANIKTIKSIPLYIPVTSDMPDRIEVRGEVLMSYDTFNLINSIRERNGDTLFANPRNAASGSLKLQDPREVAKRQLDAFFYFLLGEDLPTKTHFENISLLKYFGFKTSAETIISSDPDIIKGFIDKWDERRKSINIPTDGIVLKVDDLSLQETIGMTSKCPKWAIAYKYNAESVSTILESVTFQVGRTGVITPVANFTPVSLCGTIVKRATLHNADIMDELDLHSYDTIFVEKGGEIIPKVTGVDLSKRKVNSMKIPFISTCPSCKATLVRSEEGAGYYCPNEECKPKIIGKFCHYFSRGAMNIIAGDATAELLIDGLGLRNISQLYELTHDMLVVFRKWSDKSASKLIESINASKSAPFENFLFALGIRHVGKTTAKKIVAEFKTMDAIIAASVDDLAKVDDVGEVVAKSIFDYFSDAQNKMEIERLRSLELPMVSTDDTVSQISDKLLNKTIVISGTFNKHTRDEYKELVEKHGGKIGSSISAKTSYVLAGDNMGPAKLEKANKLNIPIISEGVFLDMIPED